MRSVTIKVRIEHLDPAVNTALRVTTVMGPSLDSGAAYFDVLQPGESVELVVHQSQKILLEEFDG